MNEETKELLKELIKARTDQVSQKDQLLSYLGTGILFVSVTLVVNLDIILGLFQLIILIFGWLLVLVSLITHLGAYYVGIKAAYWVEEEILRITKIKNEGGEMKQNITTFDLESKNKNEEITRLNKIAFYSLVIGMISLMCFAVYMAVLKA